MTDKKKTKEWKQAEEIATNIVLGRHREFEQENFPYRDEDEMIEEYRFLREEIYWEEMARKYGRY